MIMLDYNFKYTTESARPPDEADLCVKLDTMKCCHYHIAFQKHMRD